MSAGIWFWLIFVLCAVFVFLGVWQGWPVWSLLLVAFILLGLVGWKVFGPPVQ